MQKHKMIFTSLEMLKLYKEFIHYYAHYVEMYDVIHGIEDYVTKKSLHDNDSLHVIIVDYTDLITITNVILSSRNFSYYEKAYIRNYKIELYKGTKHDNT